jgi:hypothetical protein
LEGCCVDGVRVVTTAADAIVDGSSRVLKNADSAPGVPAR